MNPNLKYFFFLGGGGGGAGGGGGGKEGARVSEFFLLRIRILNKKKIFFFLGGRGRGGGKGPRVSELFFTKNPNLIFFLWGGGGGPLQPLQSRGHNNA